jgi:drug/metabolite transporter (DMT)-like permease
MTKTHPQSLILLLLASIVWGFAFVAQRQGMEHIGPLTFNGIRFLLGAVSLLPLFYLMKPRFQFSKAIFKPLALGMLAGIALFFAATFQQIGIIYTSAGNAGFITSLYIIFVPAIGLFTRKKSGVQVWVGASLALTGLYFLTFRQRFEVQTGDMLVLISAVFWAFHLIILGYLSPKFDFRVLAFSQYAFTGIISLALGLMLDEPLSVSALQQATWPILYTGIASVGIGYTLQMIGQQRVRPDHAALVLSLEAVFAALGGWLILAETMDQLNILGCSLMFIGVIIAQISFKSVIVPEE